MPKFSVKKPLTVFVAVIAILVLGAVAYFKMTPDLLPNMDFPYVVVVTTYPGATPEEVEEQVREMAVKVYSAIGCQGLSRVDFFVCHKDNRIVFNEINTLPGFTSISMFPKLFGASGIPYGELIDQLLQLAVEAAE